jgi:hypothetical protein
VSTQPQIRPIGEVNLRIDACIKATAVGERLLWGLLSVLFLVGIFVLVYGVYFQSKLLICASMGASGTCTWPIVKLTQLHRRKIALSVIPAITALLSPRDAAREIHLLVVPPNPTAYADAPPGSVFVEFKVPSASVRALVGSGWAKIYGPNSIFGEAYGIKEMPEAFEIKVVPIE